MQRSFQNYAVQRSVNYVLLHTVMYNGIVIAAMSINMSVTLDGHATTSLQTVMAR